MPPVKSTMLALGVPMPPFALTEPATGKTFSSVELAGAECAVVAFICNHCPFVKHIAPALAEFGRWCEERGARVVAINPNDVANYPEDSPEKMAEEVKARGYTFPYLFDEAQSVAKAFEAACTPDFFVFDANGKLAYRGQFDDSRPNSGQSATGADVRAAVEDVLAGKTPPAAQSPSVGCSIKWKPGAEPAYMTA